MRLKRTILTVVLIFLVFSFTSFIFSPLSAPLPPMEDGVRIAVVGDFGQGGRPERLVAKMINEWNVDAVVTVGDNIYPSGKQKDFDKKVYPYFDWVIDRGLFFPALGNHDWGYPWDAGFEAHEIPLVLSLPYLPGNGRYYSVPLGENLVQIFIVDSDQREPDGRSRDSIQGKWLQEALRLSEFKYKLVFLHEPPYSSCLFGDQEVMQWPFDEWGADAVFAGHCHFYERVMKNGFPYFVNGLGGSKEVTPFEDITEGSTVRFIDDYGAQLIEATPDQLEISFITLQRETMDVYIIPSP